MEVGKFVRGEVRALVYNNRGTPVGEEAST